MEFNAGELLFVTQYCGFWVRIMSIIEHQLNALTVERRGYAMRVEALVRSHRNPVEIDGYMSLIARINESIIVLARRSGM